MSRGNLSTLQVRILALLADVQPRWTLTDGGAIVGFHIPYRTTRDLDLFWRGRAELGEVAQDVLSHLRAVGLEVRVSKRSPAFMRLEVLEGDTLTIVDLVADPVRIQTEPGRHPVGGKQIQVDSIQELLINKLVAMLSRYELRDLADVRVLIRSGADLDLALRLAPNKDGGFSAAVLAWVLQSFPFQRYRSESSLPPTQIAELERFHADLIATLITKSDPGDRVCERP